MVRNTVLTILIVIGFQLNTYALDYALNEPSWQKDGRSMGLGGGMNAIDQETSEGLSINYLLPYLLAELSTRSLKIAHQTKWMNLEGMWAQSGDVVFRENYIALGVSRYLSGTFMLKIKAGYYQSDLISGEKGSTFLAEINCKYKLNEKLEIDVYLFNPSCSKIKKTGYSIPLIQSFHLGATYSPAKNIQGLVEIEKSLQDKAIGHLGLEYDMFELFSIRAGFSSQPFMPSWGIGGRYRRFNYSLGANNHPILGFSSCFSLGYKW